MTELQIYGNTELQNDRQGKSSIAPTFSKRGYNKNMEKFIIRFISFIKLNLMGENVFPSWFKYLQ